MTHQNIRVFQRAFDAALNYLPPEIVQDIKRGVDRKAEYSDKYLSDLASMQLAYRSRK